MCRHFSKPVPITHCLSTTDGSFDCSPAPHCARLCQGKRPGRHTVRVGVSGSAHPNVPASPCVCVDMRKDTCMHVSITAQWHMHKRTTGYKANRVYNELHVTKATRTARMQRWTDRQTDGWMDRRTDGRMDGRMDTHIRAYEHTRLCAHACECGRVCGFAFVCMCVHAYGTYRTRMAW